MGWLYLNTADSQIFQDAIHEIDTDTSERAVGVVAASFVEDHLTRLIRVRIQKEQPEGSYANEMFQPTGALGNFGTKINLGYFMGFYSEQARKELNTIQGIRNEFAHKLAMNSFDVQSIKARCCNLKIWETHKIKVKRTDKGDGPIALSLTLGKDLEEDEQSLDIADLFAVSGNATARHRYATACKFFIGAFSVMINEPVSKPHFLF